DMIQQQGAATNSKGGPIGKSKHQCRDYNCSGTHVINSKHPNVHKFGSNPLKYHMAAATLQLSQQQRGNSGCRQKTAAAFYFFSCNNPRLQPSAAATSTV
ncbi:hypothetical protein ACLOJK_028299, partial [Asimina triloba]